MEFYNYIKKLPLPKKQYLLCVHSWLTKFSTIQHPNWRNKLPHIIGFPKRKRKIKTHTRAHTHIHTQPSVAQNTVSRPYLQATCNNCQIQFSDKKNPFSDEKILISPLKYCFSLTIHKKLLNPSAIPNIFSAHFLRWAFLPPKVTALYLWN